MSTSRKATAVIAVFAVTALLGIVSGALFAYSPDLATIAELDNYTPGTITRIHGRDGQVIGEFATERRMIVGYDDIGKTLRNAIVAAEDGSFFEHVGFDISRIAMTLATNVRRGDLMYAGFSTLTMQLARKITIGGTTLGPEKRLQRKLVEMYYTLLIEKRYTKREILTLYANQMWLGTATIAASGVESAARLYFGKSAKDLRLEEAALIAGILQRPTRQSPLVNPTYARQRRNYTLQRMADEGFVTQAEADEAKALPIQLAEQTERANVAAPYFVEEIRQHLEHEYGVERLYQGGLTVTSTLDPTLQAAAQQAVADGLRAHDKRHGFRPPTRNILTNADANDGPAADADDLPVTLDNFDHRRWRFAMEVGDVVPAVVTAVDGGAIHVRFGTYAATIDPDGYAWTGRSAARLVEPGDLIDVQITELGDVVSVTLDQEPLAEAAVVAIENATGRVLAMVGGYSFERSKFNRATQAQRQLGSLFKGMLYAAAIDQGYTTTTIVQDEPVSYDVGPEQDPYEPTNYDDTYEGPITLRHALEDSRNAPAVWLMNEIGPETVIEFARRVGFVSPLPPFLSIALGASEATLMEVTSAYSAFPNQGTRMVPYTIDRVVDRAGTILEAGRPIPQDALRPDTAYIMVSLMRGVVERGTGASARQLSWPVGGKTGTMDDYTDAWFVGFDPEITVGVWVGYDEKKTLGEDEQGAAVALPIWRDVMRAHIADHEVSQGFDLPDNIVFVSVDRRTGELAEPWAPEAIQEAFIVGTEPGATFRQ